MHIIEEPLILSVDTATDMRSVAVARGEQVLYLNSGHTPNWQSASLLCEVDAALRATGVRLDEIGLFAVAAGPGSFTGLRTGLATIKGLAATLDRPVVGVPTLYAVARASGAAMRILAALPAGRGEVFAQFLKMTAAGTIEELDAPAHLRPEDVLERVAGLRVRVRWAVCGAPTFTDKIREYALRASINLSMGTAEEPEREAEGWTLAPPIETLAEHVAVLALESLRAGRSGRAENLRAVYVRPSDAELSERCRALN